MIGLDAEDKVHMSAITSHAAFPEQRLSQSGVFRLIYFVVCCMGVLRARMSAHLCAHCLRQPAAVPGSSDEWPCVSPARAAGLLNC